MNQTCFQYSTNLLDLTLQIESKHLRLDKYGTGGSSWLNPACSSRLFTAIVNGRRYDAANMEFVELTRQETHEGVMRITAFFKTRNFRLEQHIKIYEGTALIEIWPVIHNHGKKECRISRIDAFSLDLHNHDLQLQYYTSSWGREFEPQSQTLAQKTILQTRTGRSSNGQHPWFGLFATDGRVLCGSIAWSGNWIFRFEPLDEQTCRISGGMHDWEFEKTLQPGETLENPACILALGADLDAAAQQFARVGRHHWYPQNTLSNQLPVEWNHWWSYEDVDINEQVFIQNISAAAEMGVEVVTLDAGWFGPADAGSHWYDFRGDWNLVNKKRFPHGIRPLAEKAHALGMHFGLWCEIEGLGKHANLAENHPEYVALRKGERVGCVCFGSPAVQEWAYQTLSGLIEKHQCDWIKLDFNLDPGAGCDRIDHGHQQGDGLYEHYRGYYGVLQRLRGAYPEVILENCSSGGLRIDLGILQQTHMTFLSDPDWPVHDLQIFWGASTMIAANTCLHWSFSEWRMQDPPAQQSFNPRNPHLTLQQLDYYTRISMLGLYGFSQKLLELPDWVFNRLTFHTHIYKQHVRHFVRQADLYHLLDQPQRSGLGERWSAFQYSLPNQSQHLLFVFRLPGGSASCLIRLRNLQENRLYTIAGFEGEPTYQKTGRELMSEGIVFDKLVEEDSSLLKIY